MQQDGYFHFWSHGLHCRAKFKDGELRCISFREGPLHSWKFIGRTKRAQDWWARREKREAINGSSKTKM